ncbi:MAG: hypothetical protein ACK4R8_08410 [Thiobacillus sp.]
MNARTLTLALLLAGSTGAHAQFGGMMNPMTMMAPMGMMATPMMMPMGAGMMSSQMYNPQSMMNPYLNPMAAGNPYMNQGGGMMNPFAMMQPAPAYGGYAAPAMPFFPAAPAPAQQMAPMPYFPAMPTPAFPMMMPTAPAAAPQAAAPQAAAPQAAAPTANPFDPSAWMQMMGGMMAVQPATPAAPETK